MPFAPHSRARIASNLVQQDLSNPSRGISHEQYNAGPPADTLDFVQELIDANKDLWEQLVNNEFCAKMAAGTASLDGFRYYMIQDTLYLQNYVRYKLGLFQKAQNWDDLSQAATSIKNDVDFANDQLTVCVEKLGVPKDIVLGTAMNHDMMDYTMFEDQEALTDDWFSLHVVLLPCLVGYYKIAKKLDEDTATLKNTVFYDIWISGNLDDSSAKKSRDFCNTNAAQWQSPIQKQKWTSLFRHACEMEIKAFHIGVQAPSPYMTIPDETYYCIVNSSGQVAVDLENSDFTAKTQDKSESHGIWS
ncbi:heme oxygenase-like protein [Neolentinus lepideus HHB14362 ss-1]|uniref:Heme oxygenase-like protein n=1 Tax=Neolentinus lepideus HHB14362 ss-1 TaxID=1314782 RepID=A0A165SQH4_9AGAM|nr:heme oxygenase-like protein [Neolentinus lepideus HHB14362 ss-1]